MVIFITFVQFALIVGVVIYLAVNMLNLVRVDPAAGLIPNLPFISVCVPARDEERSISLCLTSLLNQDYPQYEVIAIDDHSKDNTLEIMRTLSRDFPNLKIIKGAQLPPDWYGKSFALHQAYKQTRGEYLLFTDADPVFKSHALTSAIVFMKTNNLDMLTLMPGTQLVTFWEITIQPVVFAFISGLTRFRKVNTLSYPNSMGIGAFILIKRN